MEEKIDLRNIAETERYAGAEGETVCPACHAWCPAKWEEWSAGVLMMTFACACGTALELEEAA
jgi:hypothetical protein